MVLRKPTTRNDGSRPLEGCPRGIGTRPSPTAVRRRNGGVRSGRHDRGSVPAGGAVRLSAAWTPDAGAGAPGAVPPSVGILDAPGIKRTPTVF